MPNSIGLTAKTRTLAPNIVGHVVSAERSPARSWRRASFSPGGDPIAQARGRLLDAHQARALSSRPSDPDRALSDGLNMVQLREMKSLLRTSMAFDKLANA